jgi:ABC-type transport system involved in cytochrome c biogenesis permease component
MNSLPVIARELRLTSRQANTYWMRCGVAAIAAMAAVQEMVLSANATNPNLVGEATFRAVSGLGFFLACGCVLLTADTLSRERRDGTLGLLLLTKLKGYDIVLGKLCASGLTASYASPTTEPRRPQNSSTFNYAVPALDRA